MTFISQKFKELAALITRNIFSAEGWHATEITAGDFRLLYYYDEQGKVRDEYWEEIH